MFFVLSKEEMSKIIIYSVKDLGWIATREYFREHTIKPNRRELLFLSAVRLRRCPENREQIKNLFDVFDLLQTETLSALSLPSERYVYLIQENDNQITHSKK